MEIYHFRLYDYNTEILTCAFSPTSIPSSIICSAEAETRGASWHYQEASSIITSCSKPRVFRNSELLQVCLSEVSRGTQGIAAFSGSGAFEGIITLAAA